MQKLYLLQNSKYIKNLRSQKEFKISSDTFFKIPETTRSFINQVALCFDKMKRIYIRLFDKSLEQPDTTSKKCLLNKCR